MSRKRAVKTGKRISLSQTRDTKEQAKQALDSFLEENGFCKMVLEYGYDFIRIEKNVVKRIEVHNIKGFVRAYIDYLDEEDLAGAKRGKILDAIYRGVNVHFGQGFLEFLNSKEIDFKEDTKDESYIFYKNGFVKVITVQRSNPVA